MGSMENLKESVMKINDLLANNPKGLTVNEISEGLGVNRNTVAKYLEVMLALGEVEMKQYGPAKVWFYSPGISLNTLMDYSTSMIAVLDSSLHIKQINSTFLAFLGMEEDEVRDVDAREVLGSIEPAAEGDGAVAPDIKELLQTALDGEAVELEEVELPSFRHRGSTFISIKIYPTVLGGKEKGVALICDEITDKVQYERALEESERLFHSVFNGANDGMAIIQDGKFALLNPRASEIIGVKHGKGVGVEVKDVVAEHHRDLVVKRLRERFEGRGTKDIYEVDITGLGGEQKTIEVSGSLIDYKGRPADLVIIREMAGRENK